MVRGSHVTKTIGCMVVVAVAALVFAPVGLAQEEEAATAGMSLGEGLSIAAIAIGAALAILGSAFATARAQAAIGSAGAGALAEKPELFGRVFILVALPETMVVLGFVLGILITGLAG